MCSISEIYKMLDCRSTCEEQSQGMKLASGISDLSLLILPFSNGESKSMWENCARVLCEMTDDRLGPFFPQLLEWLRDMNWPGAILILERLKQVEGHKLRNSFVETFTYASVLNNDEGLMWLDCLSELLDNASLKDELPKKVLEELEKHYHNWGAWSDD